MPQMIALIRGINVSGHNKITMARLREIFVGRGAVDVVTYLQSGNVIFGGDGSASKWTREIAHGLKDELGGEVSVMIRTPAELKKIVAANPFAKLPKGKKPALHVTFLDDTAGMSGLKKLAAIDAGDDKFLAAGREIYLYCPNGYGRTKLANAVIEKALALHATTRNWNSVTKLADLTL